MVILPKPQTLIEKKGTFILSPQVQILIHEDCNDQTFNDALFFQEKILNQTMLNLKIIKGTSVRGPNIKLNISEKLKEEMYELEIDTDILISGGSDRAIHYGLMTLLQIVKNQGCVLPKLFIEDHPQFKHRGVYHDVARGKVASVETLEKLIDTLSEYKINELQLYIEHSYLYEGISEAFRDKDPMSAEDIMRLDRYAQKRHIELIPSIATFGHMYEILRTRTFADLSEKPIDFDIPYSWVNRMAHHTLDVSNEKSIELVRSMINQFVPLFKSNKFNICADETFDLGAFKNKDRGQKEGVGRLYVDFLTQIIEIVQEKDKQVLFWGDIILKHPELLNEIPSDVTCLNWGYFATENEDNTATIAQSGIPQYVCPSTTGWNRMINWYDNSSENIRTMINHATNHKAMGILNTDWGDHGHVNLLGSSMPMLVYGAALSWNNSDAKNDDIDDREISISYYGKKNEGLMNLLRRISRNQTANWSFINFHLEREYGAAYVIEPYFEIMEKLDPLEIKSNVTRLIELKKELLRYGTTLSKEFYIDFREFLVMSELMKLTQESYLYMQHFDMKVNHGIFTRPASEIAVDIEYTIEEYKECWRLRNKESELNRVVKVFHIIADKLRSY